jgi:ATP-dependent exoDNAse (exonuclease V) beta subunit
MYVISVKSNRVDRPSAFLPLTGYEPGQKPRVVSKKLPEERKVPLRHPNERAPLQAIAPEKIGMDERKRGEFIHAVLSRIEFLEDNISEQVNRISEEVRNETRDQFEKNSIESPLIAFLGSKETRGLFRSTGNRQILTEKEFAQADGRLNRMDRVVVDPVVVTVVDFKTGDEQETYSEQVHAYMNILRDIYPGHSIRGYLAYVDRNVVREVKEFTTEVQRPQR